MIGAAFLLVVALSLGAATRPANARPLAPAGPVCGEEATEDAALAAPGGVAAGWNGEFVDLTWEDTTDEVCYLLVIVEHGPALDEVDRRVESPDADTTVFTEHRSEYDESGATQVEFALAAVYGERRSPFATADLSIPPLEPITPTAGPPCGEEATEDPAVTPPAGLALSGFDANEGLELTWDDTDGERCYLLVITEYGPGMKELQRRVESPDADVTQWWEHRSEYDDTRATTVQFALAAVYSDARSPFVSVERGIPQVEQPPCGAGTTEDPAIPAPAGFALSAFDANGERELTWDDTDGEQCYVLFITEIGRGGEEVQRRVVSLDADVTLWTDHRSEYDDTGATTVQFALAAVYDTTRSPLVVLERAMPPDDRPTASPTVSVDATPTPTGLPDTGDPVPAALPLAVVAGLGAVLLLAGAGVALRLRG